MLRSLRSLCVVPALLALASCYQPGPPVADIANASPWFSLNFDEMLHEGDAQAEALSFCATTQCPQRLVVGLIKVSGDSAIPLENILRHPSLLTAELKRRAREPTLTRAAKPGSKQHIETVTTVTPLHHASAQGFALTMVRKDGKGRIHATALGWRDGDVLHVLIAIGENAEAVTEAAVRAVAHHTEKAARP